jgi:sortase A
METRVQRLRMRARRRTRRRVGLSMVVAGLALLGGVAYQLWGTGIVTSRAQAGFRHELAVRGFPTIPREGRPVGVLRIDRIGLDMAVVQAANWWTLQLGPGHNADTPLPGQGGNVVIAGHRTTFLHPFWSLDRLGPGDLISLETASGRFIYRVVWQRVVAPSATWVKGSTAVPSLTLSTCTPRFSSARRLVVRAVQVYGAVPGGFLDRLPAVRQSGGAPRP